MEDLTIKIGDILQDKTAGTRYRVIAIVKDNVSLCIMGIKRFQLMSFGLKSILLLLTSGDLIRQEEEPFIVDVDALPDDIRADYENKLHMMREVEHLFGPDFIKLNGRGAKPGLKKMLGRYEVSSPVFWKLCRRYFQSGRKETSLIDARALSPNKGRSYSFTKKPGRRSDVFPEQGVLLTREVLDNFEEVRRKYLSGDLPSWKKAYEYLIAQYYYSEGSEDGTQPVGPYPISEIPTQDQFYYYMKTHLTHEEVRKSKTSSREVNNNERLLLGDPMQDTAGCGDCVEIDACEFDVCLVSTTDKGQSVSHPTVYIALDQFSKAIVGCAVAYEQNSVMGITNLFLNLGDDKSAYCRKYGIGLKDSSWWPSNFLPARIRMDRGAEMASKELDRICNELGIQKDLVPPGSGSLKGYVESIFRQMQAEMRPHLAHNGGVDHRHGSKPHEEAQLDIWDYTKMVIAFVLYYNNYYMKDYHLTKEMMDADIEPKPKKLWEYGCRQFGDPMPISNPEQYQFALMTPIKPQYNRKGICYEKLWYVPEDDTRLLSDMMKAQNTKKPLSGVRMDMRCVDAVYYVRDGRLFRAALKPAYASFANCTMEQWKAYRKQKGVMDAVGRIENERQDVDAYLTYESIVSSAQDDTPVSGGNIRPARERDRQAVNASLKMEDRPASSQDDPIKEMPVPELPDDVSAALSETDSRDARRNAYDVDDGADADRLAAVERAFDDKIDEDIHDKSV